MATATQTAEPPDSLTLMAGAFGQLLGTGKISVEMAAMIRLICGNDPDIVARQLVTESGLPDQDVRRFVGDFFDNVRRMQDRWAEMTERQVRANLGASCTAPDKANP